MNNIQQFYSRRVEVIIIESPYVVETIQNHLSKNQEFDIEYVYSQDISAIHQHKKINLLIVETKTFSKLFNKEYNFLSDTNFIKDIISLGDTIKSIKEAKINLKLPCRLATLLEGISQARADTNLFCCINKQWIYNQQIGILSSNPLEDEFIAGFTTQENKIFAALLTSTNHQLSKEKLLHNILGYHPTTDSNAIEAHLHRLRQKLPKGLLHQANGICQLHITEIM